MNSPTLPSAADMLARYAPIDTPPPFHPDMLEAWWRPYEQSIAHLVEWNRVKQARLVKEWAESKLRPFDFVYAAHTYGEQYARWCALRNLEKFIETRGRRYWVWFFGDDHMSCKMPKRPEAGPAPYIDPLAMVTLLDHIRLNECPIFYYIVAVAYNSLLRPSELMNLRTQDLFIYAPQPYIYVNKGKGPLGGKSREAPISLECAGLLQVYLQARSSLVHLYLKPGTLDEGWLWVKPNGQRLDAENGQWAEVMKRAYKALGVNMPNKPRAHMRKTGAQHAHLETEDKPSEPLVHLGERMGHAGPGTTSRYARIPGFAWGRPISDYQPKTINNHIQRIYNRDTRPAHEKFPDLIIQGSADDYLDVSSAEGSQHPATP